MPIFFLDTSALVKRYATEIGTQWVQSLCDPASGNTIVISQLAQVEVIAALCGKERNQIPGQGITATERDRVITLYRADLLRNYTVISLGGDRCTRAADLCITHTKHKLQSLDAIQLACALAYRVSLPRVVAALGVTLRHSRQRSECGGD